MATNIALDHQYATCMYKQFMQSNLSCNRVMKVAIVFQFISILVLLTPSHSALVVAFVCKKTHYTLIIILMDHLGNSHLFETSNKSLIIHESTRETKRREEKTHRECEILEVFNPNTLYLFEQHMSFEGPSTKM